MEDRPTRRLPELAARSRPALKIYLAASTKRIAFLGSGKARRLPRTLPETAMRFLMTFLMWAAAASSAMAAPVNPPADEGAIRGVVMDYFRANDDRRADLLRRAFQPSMVMYRVKPDGSLTGLDLSRWAARLSDASRQKPARKRSIEWLEIHGDAASVETLSVFEDHQFRDFLSLLKVQGRWRIVGKVYVDQPAGATVDENPGDVEAVRRLIRAQFKSMDDRDGHLLSTLYDPRALSFSVDRDELTAVAMGEWAGRFDEAAARKEFPQGVVRTIDRVVVRGNVAWARFSHRTGNHVVVDTALFAKVHGAWRAVNLTYVVVAS
jgi:hypothetical protein